ITIIIILVILTLYKCNTNGKETPILENLLLQKMSPLNVPEPSGLAFSYESNSFWSVSDSNSKVYKLDLKGNIIKSFVVNGEDLEGITVIDSDKLAVILERTRDIVVLDTSGKEIKRKKFDLKGKLNEGLEGICYDASNKNFYLLNEKHPGLLIKTDADLNEIFRIELNFASDYSDIFFSVKDTTLWILSDESKMIVQTDLNGNPINIYKINVDQPEGLVVDYSNKKVYVVSDKKAELYEYKLP
ncbi:MAG: SdiA-regulated domain-containing protein, partial [Ignavibacterium sp.]|nr:SdiA-regulated domain-containing protein [Ignavibacterium sp.]